MVRMNAVELTVRDGAYRAMGHEDSILKLHYLINYLAR